MNWAVCSNYTFCLQTINAEGATVFELRQCLKEIGLKYIQIVLQYKTKMI